MLSEIEKAYKTKKSKKKETLLLYDRSSKSYYVNRPFGFDIETTSWVDQEGEKRAHLTSYGIDLGQYKHGRSWQDLLKNLQDFKDGLEAISSNLRAIIWVHNLSYEAQFMLPRLYEIEEIDNLLSLDIRKPIKFQWGALDFRCSYALSGKSLAKIAKDLGKEKSKDWDYSLQRNSKTPLSDDELEYQRLDVEIMLEYIQTEIEYNKGIVNIPLTKTGYVRREIKRLGSKSKDFRYKMACLPLKHGEYIALFKGFLGGYTHASKRHIGKELVNVASYDIVSSYPSVMLCERYPKRLLFENVEISKRSVELGKKLGYLYMFRAQFENLRAKKDAPDYYISLHKTVTKRGGNDLILPMVALDSVEIGETTSVFNGRIEEHKGVLTTYITHLDLEVIDEVYTYDNLKLDRCYVYEGDYLPKEYFMLILDLYKKKDKLKGVAGKAFEYMKSKEMLNSLYGMTVEQVLKDEISYNENGWNVRNASSYTKEEIEEILNKENSKKSRFRHYSWGVYVTAYARRNLWSAILELKDDYIYSDTDSVKFLNHEKHAKWFENYNKRTLEKVNKALKAQGIKESVKMGIYELEGVYSTFKTLGAKRYLYEEEGELHLTCAGVSKQAVSYIKEQGGFSAFEDGLAIPSSETQKRTHFYSDNPFTAQHEDYLGNASQVSEAAYIYLEDAPFSLSVEKHALNAIKRNLENDKRH